jgi:hypothetical protein
MSRRMFGRGFGLSAILLIVAVALFLLDAFGASLGDLRLIPLGLGGVASPFFFC